MRLLRLLQLDAVGLAVRIGVLAVVAVVALVCAGSVIVALLGLRGVLRRGLLVIIVVVGLCVGAGSRGPAGAVKGALAGLAAAAGGYAAGGLSDGILEGGRPKLGRCYAQPDIAGYGTVFTLEGFRRVIHTCT